MACKDKPKTYGCRRAVQGEYSLTQAVTYAATPADRNCRRGCHCGCNNGCGCGCTDPDAPITPPYYDGPCPSTERVPGCHPPCPGALSDSYAFLVQTGTLSIAAGAAIPFSSAGRNINNIRQNGGVITLLRAGTYFVSYSLNIPANYTFSSTLAVCVNGEIVPGTVIDIDKTGTSTPVFAGNSSIITVPTGSTLSVISSAAISLSADSTDDALATLNIFRIS